MIYAEEENNNNYRWYHRGLVQFFFFTTILFGFLFLHDVVEKFKNSKWDVINLYGRP
jgi:hypothetical protein